MLVAVDQAGRQAGGAVDVAGVHRGRNLEAGGLIVDVIAGIVVDRDHRHGAVAVQAGVKLVQQVHQETLIHQLLLDQAGDLHVDIRFGQCDLAFSSRQTAPESLPEWPATMPMRRLRLGGVEGVDTLGLGGQDQAELFGEVGGEEAVRHPGSEEDGQQDSHAEGGADGVQTPFLPARRRSRRGGWHRGGEGCALSISYNST